MKMKVYVIKVVVLVITITIQLTLNKTRILQLAYSMAMQEPPESAENKCLCPRMLFNSQINAVIEEKL